MNGPQKSGSDLSFAGFVLLAVLGTFIWRNAPLESSRPDAGKDAQNPVLAENQIPAKLWQDPFEALFSERATMHPGDIHNDETTCSLASLKKLSHLDGSDIRVLIPMLTLSQDAEVVERRRRRRYAVISGLAEAGYIPRTPGFIGRCVLQNPLPGVFDKAPIAVPYEWYPAEDAASPGNHADAVLVLWLNESLFASPPLGRFRDLAEIIAGKCDHKIRNGCERSLSIFVLGPARSSTLADMARRAIDEDPEKIKEGFNEINIRGIHILSPTATVADSKLVPGVSEDEIQAAAARFSPANCQNVEPGSGDNGACISFLRTIQSDDALAAMLVEEITNRADWSKKLDHVALVSEWDTPFGRSLPRSFEKAFCSIDKGSYCRADTSDRIIRYSYLRGIDGKIPGREKHAESKSEAGGDGQTGDPVLNQSDVAIRRPAGNGQFDYLRRIGDSIHRKDKELRAKGLGRIRAIGIMGSDVYDKLLVLRALKPQFPHVLFFTTDLDAQLLHPSEFQWARNLLVASSFGLELREDLQGSIPAFRDSYQTSMFLSTLLATRYDVTQYPTSDLTGKSAFYPNMVSTQALLGQINPLLFEVGRDSAVRLGNSHDLMSGSVHRTPPVIHDFQTVAGYLVLSALLVMVLHQMKPLAGRPVVYSALAAALFLILLCVSLASSPNGEPLSYTSGVSAWPAEFIRYLSLCLSLYFLARLFRDLSANCARVNRDYFGRQDNINSLTPPGKTLKEIVTDMVGPNGTVATIFLDGGRHHLGMLRWPLLCLVVFGVIALGMYLTVTYHIDLPLYILAYWVFVIGIWYFLLYRTAVFKSFSGFESINAWVRKTRDDASRENTLDAWAYWKSYCELGSPGYRALRSISLLFLFMAFAALIFSLTDIPVSPTRGYASFIADKVMVFTSVPSMLILIFIVLDEFRMCIYWIQGLRRFRFDWGEINIKKKNQSMGTFETDQDMEWVKVQLIAERTSEIGQLIYYPYLVIIIMMLSRNSYFDSWGIPPGLAVVIGINILLLFLSAMKLRREAENSRRSAIGNLRLALLGEYAPGKGEEQEIYRKRIRQLIEDVQDIREGAFLPIREQPLVRASLPLLGAIGLTAGEYLHLFR